MKIPVKSNGTNTNLLSTYPVNAEKQLDNNFYANDILEQQLFDFSINTIRYCDNIDIP